MDQKAPCSIRPYRPSDRTSVASLFRVGVLEHIYPAFFKAVGHPDHLGVTLSVSVAGYVLGGSSYFQALLFGATWAGVVYYCCREIYRGYLERKLGREMADVETLFLENPDNNLWVAEVEVSGRSKVTGVVAVLAQRVSGEEGAENGWADADGLIAGEEEEDGGYGEVFFIVVSYHQRRRGVGRQLVQTAMDFCKEQRLPRLVLDVSSPQTAALALCRKLGFVQTCSHGNTHANRWVTRLARVSVLRMEKLV
ncbi:LOW QUALITY PROTEIN: N-acetylaspartate synthetase [Denticeps clupeoides]|uniref:LOW QUALITY PROTEIN: N-acetylaspartate synthetase n=1 Tax=Denticeps clupeoides TaxID=299321 RepID=UPI003EBF3695